MSEKKRGLMTGEDVCEEWERLESELTRLRADRDRLREVVETAATSDYNEIGPELKRKMNEALKQVEE